MRIFFEGFHSTREREKGGRQCGRGEKHNSKSSNKNFFFNALGERGGGAAREAPGSEPRPERWLQRRRIIAPPPRCRRRRLPSAVPPVERGGDRVAERRVEPQPRSSVKDAAGERRAEAVVKGPRALCGEERGRRFYLSVLDVFLFLFCLVFCKESAIREWAGGIGKRGRALEEKEREREKRRSRAFLVAKRTDGAEKKKLEIEN